MQLITKLAIVALGFFFLLVLANLAPAHADTAYHVGADATGGPGDGPNLIPSNTSFFIADNPNKAEAGPLSIFFAVPEGEVDPSITSIKLGSIAQTFTGPVELTALGDFNLASSDLYSFVGCTGCDKSLNFPDLILGDAEGGLPIVTSYDIFKAVVTLSFAGKDAINIMGTFAEGTYIAPLSGDGVDTSFTNAGLITASAIINPTGSPVPEPSTWVMLIAGFGLMAGLGWRKAHRTVAA